MIKAIETSYKGYRFRSRLEARWAVFFENAKLEWIYEPQGFVVNGKPYLPDFYLPQFGYFEVKGTRDYDESLYLEFSKQIGKPLFIVFSEIPDPESYDGYMKGWGFHGKNPEAWGWSDMFLQCTGCGKTSIQNEAYCTIKGNCCEGEREMPLSGALEAARSARWEHGEKP
jgi:hypothetical protein